mgnify:CR=1 FL=1
MTNQSKECCSKCGEAVEVVDGDRYHVCPLKDEIFPPKELLEWEKEFDKIVKGRKNSKYHKNYIALHIAKDFIYQTLKAQRAELEAEIGSKLERK